MSTQAPPEDDGDRVRFIQEATGEVTAVHVPSNVAAVGETEADALRELADALDSHFGRGESIDDPEAFLESEGVDVEIGSAGDPPWLEE